MWNVPCPPGPTPFLSTASSDLSSIPRHHARVRPVVGSLFWLALFLRAEVFLHYVEDFVQIGVITEVVLVVRKEKIAAFTVVNEGTAKLQAISSQIASEALLFASRDGRPKRGTQQGEHRSAARLHSLVKVACIVDIQVALEVALLSKLLDPKELGAHTHQSYPHLIKLGLQGRELGRSLP